MPQYLRGWRGAVLLFLTVLNFLLGYLFAGSPWFPVVVMWSVVSGFVTGALLQLSLQRPQNFFSE